MVKPGRWAATISGRRLGYFYDEEEAAWAYDEAAIARFGEFARTNADLGLYV